MSMQSETHFNVLLEAIVDFHDFETFLELLTRHEIATKKNAKSHSVELIRFLFLKAWFSDISPSPVVDRCWHALMLMPVLYVKMCKKLLSIEGTQKYDEEIISHDPLGGDNKFARDRRYTTCLAKYGLIFSSGFLLATIWPEDYEGTDNPEFVGRKRQRDTQEDDENFGSGKENLIFGGKKPGDATSFMGQPAPTAPQAQVALSSTRSTTSTSSTPERSSCPLVPPAPLPIAQNAAVVLPPEAQVNQQAPLVQQAAPFPPHLPSHSSFGSDKLTIKIREQGGEEMMFKVSQTTRFRKIFQAFADRRGVAVHELRFNIDGQVVLSDDTPDSLDLEDNDQIDVLLQQAGC